MQMRAYRLALDPTARPARRTATPRRGGAVGVQSHALAAKRLASQQRTAAIRELVDAGTGGCPPRAATGIVAYQ